MMKRSNMTAICGCAGIGRLASLRCLCPDGRTGSTPVSRTNPEALELQGFRGFLLQPQGFQTNKECKILLISVVLQQFSSLYVLGALRNKPSAKSSIYAIVFSILSS